MRALGITALILVFLSFVLWMVSWLYFTFVAYSAASYNSPLRYVAQGCGVLSSLTEFLAIGVLSIGLVMFAKHLPAKQ